MQITRKEIRRRLSCKQISEAYLAAGYEGMWPVAIDQESNQCLWRDQGAELWGVSMVYLTEHEDGKVHAESGGHPVFEFESVQSSAEHGELLDLDAVTRYDQLQTFLERSNPNHHIVVLGINPDLKTFLWQHKDSDKVYFRSRYLKVGNDIEVIGLPLNTWLEE